MQGKDPLTKFATPIGFASWGELSSPTRGEEGSRLWLASGQRHLSPCGRGYKINNLAEG